MALQEAEDRDGARVPQRLRSDPVQCLRLLARPGRLPLRRPRVFVIAAVHGVEYAYGAHEHATTGIFEGEPRQCPGFVFRKSILIGRTDLGPRDVRALMEELATEYTGNTYNLISKNCNHFCNEACLRLTNKPIPRWVNRLARIGFLCNCVLPVQVAAVRSRRDKAEGKREGEKRKLRSNSTRFPPPTTSSSTTAAPISSIPSSGTIRSRRRSRRSSSSSSVSSS
ncbi:deSI-like protein At4g17486 isoform X1 [Elaeis guineensis]|uniref:deSI-like protein At4g17486 isoform X1 n=1 Tax=Elaeis guineensis var. tenera TaxID=51953 RepID=UPI003C6D74F8